MKISRGLSSSIIACVLLLAGCDITIPYGNSVPLPEKGTTKVAVATVDERPYVLDHRDPSNYVGIWRAMAGNPWNFHTDDHHPLADDFSSTIVSSLVDGGFQAAAVSTQPAADCAEALKLLATSPARRWVLVEIRLWDSDTYINPTVHYSVVLHVYDSDGKELATKTDAKSQDLQGHAMTYLDDSPEVLQQFYEGKMKEWFSDPAIQAALQD